MVSEGQADRSTRPILWVGLAAGLAAVLAIAGWMRWRSGPPPSDFGPLPAFSLVDAAGQPFSSATLDGAVRVVGFVFTRCGGQCPLIVERMRRLEGPFAGTVGIERLLITVDPEFDTPAVLGAYAREMRLSSPAWRLVTGTPESVYGLIRGGFRLAVDPNGSMSAEEPILHSTRLALVDRRGHVRGYYDVFDDAALADLARAARRLARGGA